MLSAVTLMDKTNLDACHLCVLGSVQQLLLQLLQLTFSPPLHVLLGHLPALQHKASNSIFSRL